MDWTRSIPEASKGGGVVWARSILDIGTVNYWCMPVRGLLRFGGEGVFKFYADICSVIFH